MGASARMYYSSYVFKYDSSTLTYTTLKNRYGKLFESLDKEQLFDFLVEKIAPIATSEMLSQLSQLEL